MNRHKEAERRWFEHWVPTIRGKLVLYGEVFHDLYLRPGDLEPVLETGICRDILRDAIRQQAEAWSGVLSLLTKARSLSEILRGLFGDDVPMTVALTALQERLRDPNNPGEMAVEALAAELEKRYSEVADSGASGFVWLVTMKGRGVADVIVIEREKLESPHLGLVKVVDAR